MYFENKAPKWDAAGAEPSAGLQENGFVAGYKPPAAYFNYLFNTYTKCINELQAFLKAHGENTENPHKVTAGQAGAMPIVDATSADWDMDEMLLKSADYTCYKVGSNTLGTPYKTGKSDFAWGWVFTTVSSANYGTQIAFIAGAATPFQRLKRNGVIEDWTTAYLPLTGGTLSGTLFLQKVDNNGSARFHKNHNASSDYGLTLYDEDKDGKTAMLRLRGSNNTVEFVDNNAYARTIFHAGNKPSGSYSGNGSATVRTITTNGIGKVLFLRSDNAFGFVSAGGAMLMNGSTVKHFAPEKIRYSNDLDGVGVLRIATNDAFLNSSGMSYGYDCL